MKHCLLRRLTGLVPLLLGISFLSFVLVQLSPGDPAEVAIRVNDMTPTPELLAEVRAQLGLDRPFPERYLRWLAGVLRGDWGTSYVTGRPVAGELARALPPTLMLAGTAAIIMLACSLAVALVCVRHEGRAVDRLLRGLLFLGTSVPAFWAGLLLIWLFSVHLDWLPTGGLEGPSSLVLPAVTHRRPSPGQAKMHSTTKLPATSLGRLMPRAVRLACRELRSTMRRTAPRLRPQARA